MSPFWIILEILLNGFDAAYLMSFPTVKLGAHQWVRKSYIVCFWIFLTAVYSVINFSTAFSFISMQVFMLPMIFYLLIFIKGKIWIRFLWFFFAYMLIITSDTLILSIYANLCQIPEELFSQQNIYRLNFILMCKPITIIYWYLLLRNPRLQAITHQNTTFFFVASFFCFAVAALILFFCPMETEYIQFSLHWFPFFFLVLTLGNFIYLQTLKDKYKNMSWDTYLTSAFAYLYKTPQEWTIQPDNQQWQTTVSYKSIIAYYWNHLLHNQKLQQLLCKSRIFFIVFTILGLGFILLFPIIYPLSNLHITFLLFFFAFVLFLANLLYFISFKRIETAHQKRMQIQAQEMEESYHKDLLYTYENLRLFRQKLLQQLHTIWRTEKENSSYWRKQLDCFTQINQQLKQLDYTGNELVDITLAMKKELAAQYGIAIHLDIAPFFPEAISVTDMTILVDNLLDDAIHVLQNMKPPSIKKELSFSWQPSDSHLNLQLIYTYDHQKRKFYFLQQKSLLQTSKLGFITIKDIVNKYHGSIALQNSQQTLAIVMQLPLSNDKK